MAKTKNNSLRLQQAVKSIFEDYRQRQGCLGHVYADAACGCDNALQMWRGPKGDKGDPGPQGPKGDNAGSFLVDAEFVVNPAGQDPGSYLKLVLIDVEQEEQVVYVNLSELEDIYTAGNGINITNMVIAAKLGAGLTFDQQGNITSAYQFCDGLDETSNVVMVKLDANNNILGFAGSGCKGLTATVNLTQAASGVSLVLTGANGTVLNTIPLNGSDGITVQKTAGGFTWLANPSGLVSSQAGNQITVSQTDDKLYVGKDTLSYTVGEGTFTLTHPDGTTSSVTVPSAVRMLDRADMVCDTDGDPYLKLTFKRDNGLNLYQEVSLDCLKCSYGITTVEDEVYEEGVPSDSRSLPAALKGVGGKTVVWNQLVLDGDFTNATYWNANNGTKSVANNVFTATCNYSEGTTGANFYITQLSTRRFAVVEGHKYFMSIDARFSRDNPNDLWFRLYHTEISPAVYSSGTTDHTGGVVADTWYHFTGIAIPARTDAKTSVLLWPRTLQYEAGDTIQVKNCMVVDLTFMFGAGNEPTAEEFEDMLTADYYAYNAGELMSAGVTSIVSKDAEDATLDTYAIPAAVQALPGYGWSAGSVYNEVDVVNKKYTQRVGSRAYSSGDESDTSVITDGTTTYYPLATPIETDISDLLSDDNLIPVEPGGTLTFENQHGANYRIPVPTKVAFQTGSWWLEDCVREAMRPVIEQFSPSAELSLDVGCDDTVIDTAPDPVCGITLVLYTEAQYNAVIAGTSQSSEGFFTIPDPSADFTTELAAYPGAPDPYAIGFEIYLSDPDTGCSNEGILYASYNSLVPSGFEPPAYPIPLADLLSSGTVLRTESTAYPDPLHLSAVDNQDDTYTFAVRFRHEETTLTADLVSGENRVDMTPLLTKIGGKITEKPGEELTPIPIAGQNKAGMTAAGGINFYLTEQDCCDGYNEVQIINGVADDTSITVYFNGLTRPQYTYLGLAFVDANGMPVSNIGYETTMDWDTCTDISCSVAAMISGNVVISGIDFVTGDPVDDFIVAHCEEVIDGQENYGLKFTFFQAAMSTVLCLEPSCDPCIDLSPIISDSVVGVRGDMICEPQAYPLFGPLYNAYCYDANHNGLGYATNVAISGNKITATLLPNTAYFTLIYGEEGGRYVWQPTLDAVSGSTACAEREDGQI